jgi:hypothetical protein
MTALLLVLMGWLAHALVANWLVLLTVLVMAERQVTLEQLTSLAHSIQAGQMTVLLLVPMGWLSLQLGRSLEQLTSLARLTQADQMTALLLVLMGWLAHALVANWLLLLTVLLMAKSQASLVHLTSLAPLTSLARLIRAGQATALALLSMGCLISHLAHVLAANWRLLLTVRLMTEHQLPLAQLASLARSIRADQVTAPPLVSMGWLSLPLGH